ncbi:hypothetical protein VSU19_04220 [Verrucomicrobiales bacterium BCK34]|nr:hypothetical protein [Verrucomicrobiales bacterium BCK34]
MKLIPGSEASGGAVAGKESSFLYSVRRRCGAGRGMKLIPDSEASGGAVAGGDPPSLLRAAPMWGA